MSSDTSFMGIVEVEDTSPSNLPATFTRESVLLGPDWRWSTAQVEEYNDRNMLPYIPSTDIYVMAARKLQRMMSTRSTKIWFQAKWGDAYDVVYVGVDPKYSTMRTALEAAIIRYTDDSQILKKIKWINKDQLRLYKLLFFDLSGIQAAHDWMEDHIFKKSLKNRTASSKIALLTAYYSKTDTDPTGRRRSKEECNVLHTLMDNDRLRKIAEYVLGDTNIPMDIYAGMMESAIKDLDIKRSMAAQDDGVTTALSQSITDRLKDMTRRMEPSEVEEATKAHIDGVEIDDEMKYIRNRLSGKDNE